MCQNVYKNQEEIKRKETFTRLFVSLVPGVKAAAQAQTQTQQAKQTITR